MKITLNINELGFATQPSKLEAYRRAVEIRDFCGPQNGAQGGRVETFSWTTPTRRGFETEEVCIDNSTGKIVYSVTESLLSRAQEVPG